MENNQNENLLNKIDLFKIKSKKRKNALNKELYVSDKEKKSLDTQIELDEIQFEGDKIDALNSFTTKKAKNAKLNARLAKLDRAVEFQNTVNENDLVEIKKTKKRARVFKRGSLMTALISAITTCIGIGISASGVWIFQCIAIVGACVFVNKQINTLVSFKDKFFNKSRFDWFLLTKKMLIIIAYTAFSVYTNFDFWKQYFQGAGLVMFSFIFDMLSLEFAFESEKYQNLEYNDEYLEKINKVLDDEIDESEDLNAKKKGKRTA